VITIVERTAALCQPSHDQLVAAYDLLTVNAEILSPFVRATRDRKPPCDERARIAGPAGLYRQ
jgi:hypothetical protein